MTWHSFHRCTQYYRKGQVAFPVAAVLWEVIVSSHMWVLLAPVQNSLKIFKSLTSFVGSIRAPHMQRTPPCGESSVPLVRCSHPKNTIWHDRQIPSLLAFLRSDKPWCLTFPKSPTEHFRPPAGQNLCVHHRYHPQNSKMIPNKIHPSINIASLL